MKNKKCVLVAADSETMRSLLVQMLQSGGYETLTAADGLEALRILHADKPDCVVVYADIPVLNGFNLSRIIKNTRSLADIAVVVCVTELTSVYQFWNDNALSNALYVLENSDAGTLCAAVESAVNVARSRLKPEESNGAESGGDFLPRMYAGVQPDGRNGEKKSAGKTRSEESELLELTAGAYDSELFSHYMMQAAYEAGVQTFNMDELVQRMARCLAGICSYHALSIIINDDTILEYYDTERSLNSAEFADFQQVCRADFSGYAEGRKEFNWRTTQLEKTCITPSDESGRLKSYEYFVLSGNDFVGTVHVANRRVDAFNDRCHERLVFFTAVFSHLLEIAIHYRSTNRAEQKMRRAFSRFVPPEIIDSLIAGDNSLGATIGEKRKVAIMIADIRNFTGISEINKPEDVVAFLNQYFTVMVNIIKKNGGSIDKFMGDAIMALFGATMSYEDNGNRAAQAAVEMIQALESIDTSHIVLPSGFKFNIGIGIHYGDVIVGSIGCADKADYTVIGDNVNLASRVESLTKQYGSKIIITGPVKDDLRGSYQTRHLDNVTVKGKSVPVSIYELSTSADAYPEEFTSNYEKGMELYQMGAWNLASKYFDRAVHVCPEDHAAQILLERCRNFEVNPPANWNGAVTLTTK